MFAPRKTAKTFFKPNPNAPHLNQESTDKPAPELSILGKDGSQICNWMKCKDYINDTRWSHVTGNESHIYGWHYIPKQGPKLSDAHLTLAMRWMEPPKGVTLTIAQMNVKSTVEKLEKRLGIPAFRRTRFSVVMSVDGYEYFVIYGSSMWMRSVKTVSFFTWLVRAAVLNKTGLYEDIKPYLAKDQYYQRDGKMFIEMLLEKGIKDIKPDWNDIKDVGNAHANGFVTFCNNMKYTKPVKAEAVASLAEAWSF